MAPMPRLLLLHCQVPSSRFCKANSPSRNWIINSNRFGQHGGGLPPQYPYHRRGSNTPVSSLALASHPPAPPNRSRSLDGLLDAAEPQAASEATKSEQVPSRHATKSCDDIDKERFDDNETDSYVSKRRGSDDNAPDGDIDKCSVYSSSSDSKRKRNFMDRCVNKVRSLIKK